jgi:Lar family restriction alleviation protein
MTPPRDPAALADALLPCPFCGETPFKTFYVRDGRQIRCRCGASAPAAYHGPDGINAADNRAIAAWNRRAPLPLTTPTGAQRKAAEEFDALAQRAAVPFPNDLSIQHAACALLGRWALNHRTEIAAALRAPLPSSGDEWLEMAAKIVEENQETDSNMERGKHLTPRFEHNRAGLAYAAAIRALKTTPTDGG